MPLPMPIASIQAGACYGPAPRSTQIWHTPAANSTFYGGIHSGLIACALQWGRPCTWCFRDLTQRIFE